MARLPEGTHGSKPILALLQSLLSYMVVSFLKNLRLLKWQE
jgi:hypothetical protein